MNLPGHVVTTRRDGRREVLLHRSLAVISDTKIEIKASRGTFILPIIGLLIAAALCWWMVSSRGGAPIWALAGTLFLCLFLFLCFCSRRERGAPVAGEKAVR